MSFLTCPIQEKKIVLTILNAIFGDSPGDKAKTKNLSPEFNFQIS